MIKKGLKIGALGYANIKFCVRVFVRLKNIAFANVW